MILLAISVVLTAYLLGSIPWGFLFGRFRGMDIREHGSGNIGATNALRVLGKPWGVAVFILDALKGLLAVRLAIWLAQSTPGAAPYTELMAIVAAAACVVGHSFPVWLRFRGGKGVATSAGALVGVIPLAALAILVVWLLTFQITRFVSLASICAALSLPLAVLALVLAHQTRGWVLLYFSVAMSALVVWRHRGNISRLLAGTEPRFARK